MRSKRVAYLVMEDRGDFVTDYSLSFAPIRSLGWEPQPVVWRSRPDWNAFDAVYICAPWDYPRHADEFCRVLSDIDRSSAVLLNELSIVSWNLEKTYLRDIEAHGDDIVPSLWYDDFAPEDVPAFFSQHNVDKVVIKPTIGGSAMDTFVLSNPVPVEMLRSLVKTFSGRKFVVQPFVENIRDEGEFSLFFFNGEYSHAIQKTPAAGDFRVQEEHGAHVQAVMPSDGLRDVAEQVFSHLRPQPVYGRGDWVRGPDGRYLLMELELIEPSLYLRTDSAAAARFAAAFDQRFKELACK
ncbi:MAG: hypothetical protein K0U72_07920 [Gammaproteobacteria bacterium]|nr:hypothetical protein [Gammaproteobacteria bacterium]